MSNEKVALRKLLGKRPKFYLYRTDDKTTVINAYKSLDKYIGELTAEVKAFLEPSPPLPSKEELKEDLVDILVETGAVKFGSFKLSQKTTSPQTREIQKLLEGFPRFKVCAGNDVCEGIINAYEKWGTKALPKLEAFILNQNNIRVDVAKGHTPNIFVFQGERLITKFWIYPDGIVNYRTFIPRATREILLLKLNHVSQEKEVARLLKKIVKGEGAYSLDRLTHCGNCVESMKSLAKQALERLEGKKKP